MIKQLLFFLLTVFYASSMFAQETRSILGMQFPVISDQYIAEKNVKAYMNKQHPDGHYKPMEFDPIYPQYYGKDIAEYCSVTQLPKYSLRHTYDLDGELIQNEYFHLSKGFEVICHISAVDMFDVGPQPKNEKLDALMTEENKAFEKVDSSVKIYPANNSLKTDRVIIYPMQLVLKFDTLNMDAPPQMVNFRPYELYVAYDKVLDYLHEQYYSGSVSYSRNSDMPGFGTYLYDTLQAIKGDTIRIMDLYRAYSNPTIDETDNAYMQSSVFFSHNSNIITHCMNAKEYLVYDTSQERFIHQINIHKTRKISGNRKQIQISYYTVEEDKDVLILERGTFTTYANADEEY